MESLQTIEILQVGPLATNCCLLQARDDPHAVYVLDPGAEAQLIISRLQDLHLRPAGIILTHGHLDHSSAAAALQLHYTTDSQPAGLPGSKGLPLLAHRETAFWCGASAEEIHRREFGSLGSQGSLIFDALFEGIPGIDQFLEEGDLIEGTDLQVMETPGHSRGGLCLYSPGSRTLFSGDTLFCRGSGRTDLTGGSPDTLAASIRRLLQALPPETRVIPGHGPETTIAAESALYGRPGESRPLD